MTVVVAGVMTGLLRMVAPHVLPVYSQMGSSRAALRAARRASPYAIHGREAVGAPT